MKSWMGWGDWLYRFGVTPNCLENARVNPSWLSNTKSNATSMIRCFPSRSVSAALVSRSARRYSKGVLPSSSLKIRTVCHGEYPAALASWLKDMGSWIWASI